MIPAQPSGKAKSCKLCLGVHGPHWHMPPKDNSHIDAVLARFPAEMPEHATEPFSYKKGVEYAKWCRRELAKIGVLLIVENHCS